MTVVTKVAVAAGVVAVGAVVAAMVATWARPLSVLAAVGRARLGRAGLERRTLDTPAGPLRYWDGGRGRAVVLLHGAGDQAGTWSTVARALSSSHRLIVPDLPGHGASAPESGPLSVGTVRDGVKALLETLDEPAVVVGNSLGAWVGCLVAVESPDAVRALVLVNGGPLLGEASGVNLLPADRDEARRTVAALRDPGSPPVPGFVLDDIVRQSRSGPIGRLALTASDMGAFLLADESGPLPVPAHVIWGASDQLMPLAYAHRLERFAGAASLTVLDHCGHVPQVECPARFLGALTAVLGELE